MDVIYGNGRPQNIYQNQLKHEQEEDGDNEDEGAGEDAGSQDHSIFSNYDTNNDNVISRDELASYLTSVNEDATDGDLEVQFPHLH